MRWLAIVVVLAGCRRVNFETRRDARAAAHAAADRDREARIVANARVVMCTLTNAHLSPAMAGQRFDHLTN